MLGPMRTGDQVEVYADELTLKGEGVGDVEGRRVHVPGLFAGEAARVRLEHVSRQNPRAHGTLLEVTSPDPGRRHPHGSARRAHAGARPSSP